MVTYWEKCRLGNAQEETGQHRADKVVSSSGQGRDEAPKSHASGEVYGGFPKTIKQHVPISSWRRSQQEGRPATHIGLVRGNLHGDVSDIEDTQDGSKLVPSKTQVFFETA